MTITIDGAPILAYLLASIRILAFLVTAPPFNNLAIPNMVKVILSLGLSMAVASQLQLAALPSNWYASMVIALTQVLIGVGMGFVTRLLLTAISVAGSFIDLFGNFQIAAAYDPLSLNQNSVFGRFYEMIMFTLIFVTGADLLILGGLLNTFRYLPLDGSPDLSAWPTVFTTAVSLFFTIAVQIALPLVSVLFITNLALALTTKIAPTLQPLMVMQPVTIGLTLILVGSSFAVIPTALDRITDLINDAIATLGGAK